MALGKMLNDYAEKNGNATRLLAALMKRGWTDEQVGILAERVEQPDTQAHIQRTLEDRARVKAQQEQEARAAAEQARFEAEAAAAAAASKNDVEAQKREAFEAERQERKRAAEAAEYEAFLARQGGSDPSGEPHAR